MTILLWHDALVRPYTAAHPRNLTLSAPSQAPYLELNNPNKALRSTNKLTSYDHALRGSLANSVHSQGPYWLHKISRIQTVGSVSFATCSGTLALADQLRSTCVYLTLCYIKRHWLILGG